MNRYRFIIIGSGWRSLYYVRIAKTLPEIFSLEAMYCRSEEKAKRIAEEWQIHTTTSVEECERIKPDFVVVAVSKPNLAEISLQWLAKGFTVLQETPAAVDIQNLNKLWQAHQNGAKLVIAEQYTRYPSNTALLNILQRGLIGEPDYLYLSMAHEYHGASLMRAFLDVPADMSFTVSGGSQPFPVVRTKTRYESFSDGVLKESTRNIALFRWENGKTALYDFDSEQYHSPIRNDLIRIQGCRGEIIGHEVTYLDEQNQPASGVLDIRSHLVRTGESNPNFSVYPEITGICFNGESVYDPPFGQAGLSEDETAIALMMEQTGAYAKDEGTSPYPLREALQDAYVGMLMRQALSSAENLKSQPQIWH